MTKVGSKIVYTIGKITVKCEKYLQIESNYRYFTDDLNEAMLVGSLRDLPQLKRGEYWVRFEQDQYGWLKRIDSSLTCY